MNNHAKVKSAVNWSAIDIFLKQAISLIVVMILARILSPEDFGLIAMLAIFMGIGFVFSDAGFSQALIQRQNSTHDDESSIFFFNALMGVVVALALWASSSWIALFLEHPILKDIISVLALNIVINSLGSVHISVLSKKLSFDIIAKASVGSSIVSGTFAVAAAKAGLGVWSLVVQTVTSSLINVGLLWFLHSWRPRMTFSFKAIRSYFSYGGYITLAALMYVIQNNLYSMVIGKSYSAGDAGLYSRANGLMQLPVMLLTKIVSRVAFPLFSAANKDQDKMVRGLKKGLVSIMFITLPISVSMCLLAESIIKILLGEQWLGAAPVLQVLSIAAMLMPIQMLNINVLKALGYANINFKLMVVKFIFTMALLFAALPYGLVAIAWAFVCSHVFNVFINTYYSYVFLGYGIFKQLKDIFPYALASVFMGLVILVTQNICDFSYILEFIISLLLAGVSYLGICMLTKLKAVGLFSNLIRRG